MSEKTLQSQSIDIHDNMKDWAKEQVDNVYKTTRTDLTNLKDLIKDNSLEQKLTLADVKSVLTKAKDLGYTESYKQLGAGLVMSLQIALKQLSKTAGNEDLDPGIIDGVYMNKPDLNAKDKTKYANSKTRKAVKAFQAKNGLEQDGWAGPLTIAKLLEKLWTTPVVTDQGKKEEQEQKKEEKQTRSEVTTPTGEKQEQVEENLYKNSEFIFDGHIPQWIKNIFDKNNIFDKYSLQLEKNIAWTETKVDINGANKQILNLKEDFNGNTSIDLHFSKLWWDSIDFKINIIRTENANSKKFTLKRVNISQGTSGEALNETANIINKISGVWLPQWWEKPNNPIILDTISPFDVHLKLKYKNQEYQIDFDKDGKLKPGKELTFDGETHVVDIDNNKIVFTKKQISSNDFSKLTDVIKMENKEIFKDTLNIINEKDKSDFLNMMSELPVDKIQASPIELKFKIDFKNDVNFWEIKTKYKDLFKSFSIVINPYVNNKWMEVTFM